MFESVLTRFCFREVHVFQTCGTPQTSLKSVNVCKIPKCETCKKWLSDLLQDARTCVVQAKETHVPCLSTHAQFKRNSNVINVFIMPTKHSKVFQCTCLHCILCGFSFSNPGYYRSCSKAVSYTHLTLPTKA